MACLTIDTPTGPILVCETDGAIVSVVWESKKRHADNSAVLQDAKRQIVEYFNGTRTEFDLPLRVTGSKTQRAVCDAMLAISFGETVTYGDLSKQLNTPAQAIGQACGGNPIPLIIPCHRVLGANGLGGFSGGTGIETKVQLLRHEGAAGLLI